MKKVILSLLLIVIMIVCASSTKVYALDTLASLDNTLENEVVTNNVIDNTISNSLNEPSNVPNGEGDSSKEDSEFLPSEEELTIEELNKLSEKLEFTEETLIVKGNLFDYTDTLFIKELIEGKELISKYNLEVQIVDKNNVFLIEDVIIDEEYYLVLKNEEVEMKFKIAFLFDFDQNYIVNEDDKVKLLELMVEDSTIIKSEDLSYFEYVLKNKTYEMPERGDISLDMEITTEKDRYDYGDEFDVVITNPLPPVEIIEEDKDRIPGEDQTENNTPVGEDDTTSDPSLDLGDNLEKDPSEEVPGEEIDKKIYINVVSGKIDYDHEALELLSITFLDYENLSTEEDAYLFWVDNLEVIRIVLRFRVISQNSREYITIYESDICAEGRKIATDGMRTKVILNKIPKPAPPKEENKVNRFPKVEKVVERVKSSDSYASEITVKNHLIGFDYLIKNYTIKADYFETKLDFAISLHDKKYATYEISGNDNFKVGENLVIVTVTAEDGSKTEYKFNVNRMPRDVVEGKSVNSVGYDLLSMNIFLGALIVAIGLIYKLWDYRFNR